VLGGNPAPLRKGIQQPAIFGPSRNFVGLNLRNEGTYRQSEKNC